MTKNHLFVNVFGLLISFMPFDKCEAFESCWSLSTIILEIFLFPGCFSFLQKSQNSKRCVHIKTIKWRVFYSKDNIRTIPFSRKNPMLKLPRFFTTYRQQPSPLLHSIAIWPAGNSRLIQRETNHYIARCASVLAWFYFVGSSPEQLVIDLFAQHQRFAVCYPYDGGKRAAISN